MLFERGLWGFPLEHFASNMKTMHSSKVRSLYDRCSLSNTYSYIVLHCIVLYCIGMYRIVLYCEQNNTYPDSNPPPAISAWYGLLIVFS